MSTFLPVHHAADDNSLPDARAPQRDHVGSADFLGRIRFKGPQARADAVAVSLALLKRLSLAPHAIEQSTKLLATGCVHLEFFGVCNPVPMFTVKVGSIDQQRIYDAVQANIGSTKYLSALRVLRWREPHKTAARLRYFNAVGDRLRDQLPWPTQEDYRRDPAGARQRHDTVLAQYRELAEPVSQRRHARLARLAAAATPGFKSWTALLDDVAVETLAPAAQQRDEPEEVAADLPRMH